MSINKILSNLFLENKHHLKSIPLDDEDLFLPVIASQNGNRENSVYLRINLKMTMLRGAPVRGAPTF